MKKLTMSRLSDHFRGLPMYFFGCGLALAGDTVVLLILLQFHLPVAAAAAIGFASGIGISYAVSVRLAFEDRRLGDARLEFMSFVLIGLIGLGLTAASLSWLVDHVGLPPLAAKAITVPAVFLIGFSLRKQLLFTRMVEQT